MIGSGQDKEVLSVVIVDPTPAYRLGLAAYLREASFRVDEPDEPLRWVADTSPAVILLSLTDTAHDGYLEEFLQHPGVTLLALVDELDPISYMAALGRGAHGVAPWNAPPAVIAEALQAALAGAVVVPIRVARSRIAHSTALDAASAELSLRELEWLKSLATGISIAQLAATAGYSDRAMHRLLRRMYARMDRGSRSEALVKAARWGVLD